MPQSILHPTPSVTRQSTSDRVEADLVMTSAGDVEASTRCPGTAAHKHVILGSESRENWTSGIKYLGSEGRIGFWAERISHRHTDARSANAPESC
jgi:hypothetical protein